MGVYQSEQVAKDAGRIWARASNVSIDWPAYPEPDS